MEGSDMKPKITSRNKVLSRSPHDMEAYWAQNLRYDKRPFDTLSVMGGTFNQRDSEQSFALLLGKINKKL